MKYFDLTLPSPAENLACDEALLDLCDEQNGAEILRCWEPAEPFVVLGYANRVASEADLSVCDALGIPILRRCSGGGTVLQAPGCLNYSLILRIPDSGPLQTIAGTNRFILEKHRAVLQSLLQGEVEVRGHTDMVLGGLKFSGNAQRRKRHALIFHGTFLLQADLKLIGKALRMPSKEPDYRRGRSHLDFLTNLNLAPGSVKDALREAWDATKPLKQFPSERILELTRTKYSLPDWNLKF
jgi:lipoate-protein ligase A